MRRKRLAGQPASVPGDPAELDALRESEARYRDLVENATDMVYTHDLTGLFTWVNRAGTMTTGYTRDELLRMSIAEIVAPEHLALARSMIERKVGQAGAAEPTRYEVDIVRKDGQRLRVEVSTRLIVRGGQPVGVHGIARDTTERARSEEALREREARLRLVTEQMPAALWSTDQDLRFTSVQGSMLEMLQLQPERIVGTSVVEFFGTDDSGLRGIHAHRAALSGESVRYEVEWRGIALQVHVEPLRGARDAIAGTVGLALDVTARKRAEQALGESEAQFRAVFESAPVGIARVDPRGRLMDANLAFEALLGYQFDELRGRALADLVDSAEARVAAGEFQELVDGARDRYEVEHRFLTRDGAGLWGKVTMSAVRSGSEIQFCIAVVDNVSARRETEEAMRERTERLAGWVSELEQRTREISLLGEMGDLLQACRSVEEAYTVMARSGALLFTVETGAVFVQGERSLLEAVATWGDPPGDTVFGPEDCWAIRRGRAHVVDDPRQALMCPHLRAAASRASLCLLMMAQGKSVGILHLSTPAPGHWSEARQRLAATVAEHIALALANLRLQETLRTQSVRDPLTGLFNRRYLEESLELERRRAERGKHAVGVLMIDLDHFKRFNDTHGHGAGDALLREVGATLARGVRSGDVPCRYGGEEFTVILPHVTLEAAVARAEQLRVAIGQIAIKHLDQLLGPVSASIGVALYAQHAASAEAVLRVADAALYRAKATGRNRVEVASSAASG